jgi:hypothetical protein
MSNKTLSAKVANVQIGNLIVEGILLETGEYAIAQQQVASLFSVMAKDSTKWLKRILGKDFQICQVRTNRNPQAPRQNRPENAIDLDTFLKVIIWAANNNYPMAVKLRDALIGLSLQQIFCDAFGVKFDKDDRTAWMVDRFNGKTTRRIFTDAIKRHIDTHGISPDKAKWIYVDCSDKINVAVLGDRAKDIRQLRKLAESDLLRDTHAASQLRLIDRIEDFAARMVDRGTEPADATNQAITFYLN